MSEHENPIHINIDKKPYQVEAEVMTGLQLRAVPAVDITAEYDLFQVVPGEDDHLVGDGEEIELKQGMHFFSAPQNINPGQ